MKLRFGTLLANRTLTACTLLDPRFKQSGIPGNLVAEVSSDVLDMCAKELGSSSTATAEEAAASRAPKAQKCEEAESAFMAALRKRSATSVEPSCNKTPTREAAAAQLATYCSEDPEPMSKSPAQFWEDRKEKFHLLRHISARLAIAPATSANAERLVSKTGTVMETKRSRLDPDVLNKIMMANYNAA